MDIGFRCREKPATALAITEGIAPQTIKKVMRWFTTRMLDRYAHPDQKDVRAAIDTIGVGHSVGSVSVVGCVKKSGVGSESVIEWKTLEKRGKKWQNRRKD